MPETGKVSKGQMLNNFGRPVRIDDTDWKTKEQRTRNGVFHFWGYQRFNNKEQGMPTMQTVAIVELDDGRVTCKKPDLITFLDKVPG